MGMNIPSEKGSLLDIICKHTSTFHSISHITDYLGTNNNESQEFGTPGGQYLHIQLYCAMAVSHVQSVLLGKKTCLLSQQ